MAQRAVRIVVLVRAEAAGNRIGQSFGDLIVGARVVRAGVGWRDDDFGTVGAQHRALGFGDLVRQGENRAVAALLGDQGQADAGVAGGGFDDHAAGLQLAGLFGGVDDAFGNAVLGRSTGVEVFDFDGDGGFDAGRLRNVVELDERGVADEFCEAVVDGHVKSFVAGVVGFCCVAFVNRRSQTNGLWLWFENRVFPLTVR